MSLRCVVSSATFKHLFTSPLISTASKPLFIKAYSKYAVNKNFELVSAESFVPSKLNSSLKYFKDESKPIVVMLTWLLARKKDVGKYCDVYLKKGYNVMTVTVSPWQFFWPLTGSQVVAEDLLKYLHNNTKEHQQLVLHGFSIGAYLWGEVLVKMNNDLPKYKSLINTIRGQIWDSAADVTETTKGLPVAMFPRNAFLRSTMEKYVSYHLKTFYDAATQHYVRASQFFHTAPVRCPALIFVAKNDLIGSYIANVRAKETWDSIGIKTYWKCWEESRHVSHLRLHRDEYLATLDSFLLSLQTEELQIPQKMQAEI